MNNHKILVLEACVESLEQAISAQKNGAHRIELCKDLSIGGITPDRKLVEEVLQKVHIPVKVMVRPRGGDFFYSMAAFEKMVSDIRFYRELGLNEIVTGILNQDNTLDIRRLKIIGSMANPMKITLHKCIDETNDPIAEIKKLSAIPQITSILTSGKKKTALEGKELIKTLIKTFENQYTIIPAGKITAENLSFVHNEIGAMEYHGRRIVLWV